LASRGPYCTFTAPRRYLRTVLRDNPVSRMICRIERPCRSKTLISTACSWVNISTAQQKPPSSPRGVKITSAGVGQFYFGADNWHHEPADFHLGTGHQDPTHDAGYTTAIDFRISKNYRSLSTCGRSPYTNCYARLLRGTGRS